MLLRFIDGTAVDSEQRLKLLINAIHVVPKNPSLVNKKNAFKCQPLLFGLDMECSISCNWFFSALTQNKL